MRVQGPVPGRPTSDHESRRALMLIERLSRHHVSEPEIVWEMERLGYTAPIERDRRPTGRRLRRALRRYW